MRNSIFTLLLLSTVLVFTQCKKDDAGGNPDNTPANYFPTTANSSWTYRRVDSATVDTVTVTATANAKTINGKSYTIQIDDNGDTTLIAKVGSDYYRILDLGVATNIEERFLKDNVDVNATWRDTANLTFSGQSLAIYLDHTLKGKDETRTVNGKNYTKVMHVRLDLLANSVIYNSGIGGGDFYYANGVGLIDYKLIIDVNFPGLPIFGIPPIIYKTSMEEALLTHTIK